MSASEQYPRQYLYRRVVQAKLFIDQHFSETIDVSNIADEAAFSRFHFIRLFRKTYGRTPHQYLSFVRIEKAKQLLRNGKTVSEACRAVGYESLGSFTALFRRMAGHSPSTWQAMMKKKMEQVEEAPLEYVPGCFAKKMKDEFHLIAD